MHTSSCLAAAQPDISHDKSMETVQVHPPTDRFTDVWHVRQYADLRGRRELEQVLGSGIISASSEKLIRQWLAADDAQRRSRARVDWAWALLAAIAFAAALVWFS